MTPRRPLVASLAALPLAAASPPRGTFAAAPKAAAAAPGFHRLRLGEVEITALLDGGMRLPEAHAPRVFRDHHEAEVRRLPQGPRFIQAARRAVGPSADRIRTFDAARETEVLPGVTAVPAIGHTPGHVSHHIVSGTEAMLIWGDITHQTVVQLAYPRWRLAIDVDADAAVSSRLATFSMLAAERTLVGGVHLPLARLRPHHRRGRGLPVRAEARARLGCGVGT